MAVKANGVHTDVLWATMLVVAVKRAVIAIPLLGKTLRLWCGWIPPAQSTVERRQVPWPGPTSDMAPNWRGF